MRSLIVTIIACALLMSCKTKSSKADSLAHLRSDEVENCAAQEELVARLENAVQNQTLPVRGEASSAELIEACRGAGGATLDQDRCLCANGSETVPPAACGGEAARSMEALQGDLLAALDDVRICRANTVAASLGDFLFVQTHVEPGGFSIPLCRTASAAEVCGERPAAADGVETFVVPSSKGFSCPPLEASGLASQKPLIRADNQLLDVVCSGADRMQVLSVREEFLPLTPPPASTSVIRFDFSIVDGRCAPVSCATASMKTACEATAVGVLGSTCATIFARSGDGFACPATGPDPRLTQKALIRSENKLIAECKI